MCNAVRALLIAAGRLAPGTLALRLVSEMRHVGRCLRQPPLLPARPRRLRQQVGIGKSLLEREAPGVLAGEHYVGGALHHSARHADRLPDPRDAADSPRAM